MGSGFGVVGLHIGKGVRRDLGGVGGGGDGLVVEVWVFGA